MRENENLKTKLDKMKKDYENRMVEVEEEAQATIIEHEQQHQEFEKNTHQKLAEMHGKYEQVNKELVEMHGKCEQANKELVEMHGKYEQANKELVEMHGKYAWMEESYNSLVDHFATSTQSFVDIDEIVNT